MITLTYTRRRAQLETYFDRTAVQAWARMTSDAPLGSIRATVRAGRDRMRTTLLSWLPEDLRGRRVLDAGCGTGALALEAARRGAEVVAVDLSPTLIALARERCRDGGAGRLDFVVGDMLDPGFGSFDHVVAMDSLIHYRAADMAASVGALAARASGSVLFTVAPRTMLLGVMHSVGRLFPRGLRAPAIEPVATASLGQLLAAQPPLAGWQLGGAARVDSGFYISEAKEMVPA